MWHLNMLLIPALKMMRTTNPRTTTSMTNAHGVAEAAVGAEEMVAAAADHRHPHHHPPRLLLHRHPAVLHPQTVLESEGRKRRRRNPRKRKIN